MDFPGSTNKEPMVTVTTEQLRERLNRLYNAVRGNRGRFSYGHRFDYLWDLKELAVQEGQANVQIPDQWLDELEKHYVEIGGCGGRAH